MPPICRHPSGYHHTTDSYDASASVRAEYEKKLKELESASPDSTKYSIERAEEVGPHLILEVLYPNCAKCAFEGKVMVFLHTSTIDALIWKRIDPHFRAPLVAGASTVSSKSKKEAPSPSARFPANTQGWSDAVEYARRVGNLLAKGTKA